MVEGKYFGGSKSQSEKVEIVFSEDSHVLSLTFEDGHKKSVSIHDLKYEYHAGEISLRFQENLEYISILDAESVSVFRQWMRSQSAGSIYQKVLDAGKGVHILILLFIVAFIYGFYKYALPPIAEHSVYLIPETMDDNLGGSFEQVYQKMDWLDSNKSVLIQDFANELELQNKKPIKVYVLESSMVNAFALPNGHIYVFTGLLDRMQGYSELVALLGHEVGHVNHRHSMKMIMRGLAGALFVSLITSDLNGISAVLYDNLEQFESLSYSRKFEQQADLEAYHILLNNQVEKQGLVSLFERLRAVDTTNIIPDFLSTHPGVDERIERFEIMDGGKSIHHSDLKEIFEKLVPSTLKEEGSVIVD